MSVEDSVRDHYRRDDLEGVVLAALERVGADPDALRIEDLSGIDQLHAGGLDSTTHLLDRLDLAEGTTVLDVGCGIGGGARWAAHESGAHVTGIDLSPVFVDVARALTDRVGLGDRVTFEVGSATALPFPDATFERAMQNHVGMNLPDKAAVFAEVHRVLVEGGRFVVFDQMRADDGALGYPLPWAEDESTSFVETVDRYRELLTDAGFRVDVEEDRLAEVAAAGMVGSERLSPTDLFGPEFDERAENAIAATMAGHLRPILLAATA